ncbi:N-acetylgalactosamine-6-sulfatase [Novosphingobium endophyticum]|uniref:N-acetylgalactosamine-6-sulfatase n=1 Tax=Novosphingobium endophyticum TaxID=1955250 RepID=A0A916TSA4_9SPHN|nr:sulfatase-like hydrolase/transferase [Novosphingobium endophyticum]GGC01491.1 N-acetylgalactosamine-6-sulfatase [Novosphingobium endophyticum]
MNKTNSIDRRTVLAGLAATGIAATSPLHAGSGRKQPNFLFIMADDLGYADLSCYGRRDYRTPHIDALADRGMSFTSAYANSAVCTATRVGLITGRYQYRLPVGLEEPLALRKIGLPPEHPTVASLLRKAGYHTSLNGKWHMGQLPDYGPLKSGYDEFWGIRNGGVDYFTHDFAHMPDLWDGETLIEETGYLTDLLADRAIETISEQSKRDQPWFMSLHFTAPHWPWEGPDDKAESDRLNALPGMFAMMDWDGGSLATYAEMVTRLDYQVGRIVDAVRKLGIDDNTVIVFTSDNGGERYSDTWPFSGKKGELLEGGLRIPAIVVWPGLTQPGTKSDAPIMSMDWLPTFVAAGGGNQDAAFPSDGLDIRPALQGGDLPQRDLFWRYKNHGQQAMRRGRWKYLRIADNTFLFDVIADPLERANHKLREPAIYAELEAAWQAWDATMLPLDPESTTHGFEARDMADHIGAVSQH